MILEWRRDFSCADHEQRHGAEICGQRIRIQKLPGSDFICSVERQGGYTIIAVAGSFEAAERRLLGWVCRSGMLTAHETLEVAASLEENGS
jgi:hypothetical protein